MAGGNQERVKEINARLKEILLRHMEGPGVRPSAVSGLTLVRRAEANSFITIFCFLEVYTDRLFSLQSGNAALRSRWLRSLSKAANIPS